MAKVEINTVCRKFNYIFTILKTLSDVELVLNLTSDFYVLATPGSEVGITCFR